MNMLGTSFSLERKEPFGKGLSPMGLFRFRLALMVYDPAPVDLWGTKSFIFMGNMAPNPAPEGPRSENLFLVEGLK